jgi:hypothetical protein
MNRDARKVFLWMAVFCPGIMQGRLGIAGRLRRRFAEKGRDDLESATDLGTNGCLALEAP